MRATFIVLCSAMLASCGKEPERLPVLETDQAELRTTYGANWRRYGPDEFGVVCYQKSEGVSCVKVKP